MRGHASLKQVSCMLVFCALAATGGWAQYTTGQVGGLVRDPSDAVIPGATVTLRNLGTGSTRTAVSGDDGAFVFPGVPAGQYELAIEATGFSRTVVTFTVITNQTVTQNVTLRLKSENETVVVRPEAGAELVTTEAQIATTRLDDELKSLPNQGRSPTTLATYTVGIQPTFNPRGGGLAITGGSQAGSIASNGGRGRATAAQLDYTDINDWEFGGIALRTTPNEDMVQEFKVLSSNFNAEQGVKSNAQIIMVTKSGTNNLHGTAYDFLQNDVFNARDYFDRTGNPSIIRRNNYGFTAGGPIIRNRTFLFGGWEGLKQRGAGSTVVATVPSQTARANATDPVSKSLIERFLPVPTASTADPNVGTVTSVFSSPQDSYQFIIKADHQFSQEHSLSGRYLHASGKSILRFPALNTLPGFDTDFTSFARNLSISDTYVFNASKVNQLRVAYGRSAGLILNEGGLNSPRFNITGLVNFGALNFFPNNRLFNVYQLNDVFTYVHGSHNVKFGGDFRKIQDNSLLSTNAKGLIVFPSLTAFLAGQASSWTQVFGEQYRGFRSGLHTLFVQDDWKLRRDFTVNLGLRWEYQGAQSEAHELTSVLDVKTQGTIGAAGTGPLGTFHVGNPATEKNPANFGPRVGFAWNPGGGNFVVRGGYGVFFDSFNFTPMTFSRGVPPLNYSFSLVGSQISGANNFAALVNGTATIVQTANAQVGSFGSLKNFGEIQTIDLRMRNPYSQHFSLGLEYRFSGFLGRLGYVGTKGTHLTVFTSINPVVNRPAPASNLADEAARLTQFQASTALQNGQGNSRLDPRFDQVSYHTDGASSIYHSLQLELIKNLSREGLQFRAAYTWSKSIDNASDFTTEQQANDNNYAQQAYNLTSERGVSNYDIPHRFLVTGIWNLPLYRGQSGVLGRLLSGWSWQVAGLWQSGVPGTLLAGSRLGIQDVNLDGDLIPRVGLDNTRASCVAGGVPFEFGNPSTIPAANQRGVNGAPNSSNFAYVQPLLGNNGNCGRNNVRMNSLPNVDMSVFKSFLLGEKGPLGSGPWSLQFRTEAYNVFNISFLTANGNGWRTLNSAGFGLVNAAGATRRLQMALKLVW